VFIHELYMSIMCVEDMVEQEFENYTVPVPVEIDYSNWQTLKQRALSAPHRLDSSDIHMFHY